MLAPRPPGAPGAAPFPPPILSAAPMAAAPHQFVLGVQPMPVAGATLHTPVYNVIGGPGFGAPVYLSPYDYTASAGSAAPQLGPLTSVSGAGLGHAGGAADVMLVSDGSTLLTSTAGNGGGGTGGRLFHATVAGGGGGNSRAHGGAGGGLLGGAGGGVTGHGGGFGGGGGAADMLFGQPGGGATHHSSHRGGGGASGLLPAGTLVMDAEGGLYTYTMDG